MLDLLVLRTNLNIQMENKIYIIKWETFYKEPPEIKLSKGDCRVAISHTEFSGTYLPTVEYIPDYSLSSTGENLNYFGKQTFDKTFNGWPKNAEDSHFIQNGNQSTLSETVADQVSKTGGVPIIHE